MRPINEISDPRLVKALAHPLRVSILSTLEHRTASPSELAEELGVPLPNLSYHIRMLVQLDLLKLVRTRPRRGAIEHYYQAKGPVAISDQAWEEIPDIVKQSLVSGGVQRIGRQVEAAAAAGGFDDSGSVIGRHSLKLDRKGFQELSRRMVELNQYAEELANESAKRRNESDHEDEIDVGAVMMLFRNAPVGSEVPSSDGVQHKRAARSTRTRSRRKAGSSS